MLKKGIIIIVLVAIMSYLFNYTSYTAYATLYNTNTDWFSAAKYGIDGPAPVVNSSRIPAGKTYNEVINEYDVTNAANIAYEVGAGYMLINACQNEEYMIAPNAAFSNYSGYAHGMACATRDTINDLYNALNPLGIKLILYVVGDLGVADSQAQAGMGWTGVANPTYLSRLCEVYSEWSVKYGSKIAGWWVDGCYDFNGYDETTLTTLINALKSGNSNAIVCTNNGADEPTMFQRRCAAEDYTAGESTHYTDQMSTICNNRWINDIQWHHYMPIGLAYCSAGTKFSDYDLINYVRNCNANGGVITFGTGSTGATHPFDSAQYNQLLLLKEAIRQGKKTLDKEYYIDQNDACVSYFGSWNDDYSSNCYGGSEKNSLSAGSYVQFTFTGTSLKWISSTYENSGYADIYIDGVLDSMVDLWNETPGFGHPPQNTVVYKKTGLANIKHTVKIVVKGTHNTRSTGNYVTIDGFVYTNGTISNKLEAENYSAMSGIQNVECSEGGELVGYIDSGDWMDYVIDVENTGTYTVNYRVAVCPGYTGGVNFLVDGVPQKTTSFPTTGGWQNWTTVSDTVMLNAGTHTIRLLATANGWNINWFELLAATPLPCKIEAENHSGMSGIQNASCSEGGQLIGYIDSSDWMNYVIDVENAGTYKINYRVAVCPGYTGGVNFLVDGVPQKSTSFPATGGWQNWTTVSDTVTLSSGTHTIRLLATANGWNLNWIELIQLTTIPGCLEAENYVEMSGIQNELCSEGGQLVGYIESGDWMDYIVKVENARIYTVNYRVAVCPGYTGCVNLLVDGVPQKTTSFPTTGGWQNWTTVSDTVTLSSGIHTIRLLATANGWNINWFELE